MAILDMLMLGIGISGVIAIALDFILEATNKFGKNHHTFAIVNLYGSSALFAYSLYNEVWLFVVLNTFLIIVGLFGIYKVFIGKKNMHLI